MDQLDKIHGTILALQTDLNILKSNLLSLRGYVRMLEHSEGDRESLETNVDAAIFDKSVPLTREEH